MKELAGDSTVQPKCHLTPEQAEWCKNNIHKHMTILSTRSAYASTYANVKILSRNLLEHPKRDLILANVVDNYNYNFGFSVKPLNASGTFVEVCVSTD